MFGSALVTGGARRTSARPRHGVAGYAAFCVAVFLLSVVAVRLAPSGSGVAAWWPAAGVSVSALALFHRSRWMLAVAIVVFSGLANLVGGRSIPVSLGFGAANAAEALVAAWWFHRSAPGRAVLHDLRDFGRLCVATLLGAIAIGIGAGATVSAFSAGDGVRTFLSVVPSHGASVILIAPLALATPTLVKRRSMEIMANWFAMSILVVAIFAEGQALSLSFVTLLPLVWACVRFGVRKVALQIIVLGVLVTVLTDHGGGPFAAASDADWSSNAQVQFFLVVSALLLLPLAIAISERERALTRALASEELFRRGFEEALLGMLLVRLDGTTLRVVEANAAAAYNLGIGVGGPIPSELRDDAYRTLGEIAAGVEAGAGWRGEMNFAAPSGVRRYSIALSNFSDLEADGLATCQVIDVTQQHQAELELERQASRDHLTGLPNRVMFDQQLQLGLGAAADRDAPLAVMFIDLDDFKLINDGFGHRAGDRILIEVARRVAAVIRPHDLVARMGGDEFAVICPGAMTPEAAADLAARVQQVGDEPVVLDDLTYRIGLSIGVALSRPDATGEQLLGQADIALYAAKAAGKRSVRLYSHELGAVASARLRMESDIQRAYEHHEFEMYMQPVVEIGTGRVRAAEALIRWRHPERGLIPPDAWLDVAERSGLMHRIGEWVLDESCRQAATWGRVSGSSSAPTVHVNVSPRQLDVPGFADLVVETLARHELDPHRLVLELTETYLAQIGDHLVAELDTLSALGVRLAADDFGTGYSPLTRITELPVRMIKIDKQFVDEITTDPRSLAIVSSLVDLAETLQLDVVAEGVETPTQAALLLDMGCRDAQGYVWSPAVPPDEFLAVLQHSPLASADALVGSERIARRRSQEPTVGGVTGAGSRPVRQ